MFCAWTLLMLAVCAAFGIASLYAQPAMADPGAAQERFVIIQEYEMTDEMIRIVVDRDTRVEYLWITPRDKNIEGGITPILNADGTPELWDCPLPD